MSNLQKLREQASTAVTAVRYTKAFEAAKKAEGLQSPSRVLFDAKNARIMYPLFSWVNGEQNWAHERFSLSWRGVSLDEYITRVNQYAQGVESYLKTAKTIALESGFDLHDGAFSVASDSSVLHPDEGYYPCQIYRAILSTGKLTSKDQISAFVRMIATHERTLETMLETIKETGRSIPEDLYNGKTPAM